MAFISIENCAMHLQGEAFLNSRGMNHNKNTKASEPSTRHVLLEIEDYRDRGASEAARNI
jgi:hypothetical protein